MKGKADNHQISASIRLRHTSNNRIHAILRLLMQVIQFSAEEFCSYAMNRWVNDGINGGKFNY
jgi:hypothetical protein